MSERIRSLLRRVAESEGDPNSEADAELRRRFPRTSSLGALEREIAAEIANSLGRAGSRLEAALEQARCTRRTLESAVLEVNARRALVARFESERAAAERRLRDLMIQREALGFRRHTELLLRYPLPPPWPRE